MGRIINDITIYKKDGSVRTKLNSYTNNCVIKSAEQKVELLGEDSVTIKTTSAAPIECSIGDYVIVYGQPYTLNNAAEVTKSGARSFETTMKFEGLQYKLMDAQYRNADAAGLNPTASFSIVANLQLLMEVLISNANRVAASLGEVWELGTYPADTEYKDFSWSNQNCLAVLQSACQEYDTEFDIVESEPKHYVLNIRKQGSVFPLKFDYSKQSGVVKLTRKNVNSNGIVTRLYVEGGTKNISKTYRNGSERLRLDDTGSYVEDATAIKLFGVKESSKQYDDIYPHRTGRVSAVVEGNKLQFVDEDMFDLNAKDTSGNTLYLQGGAAAKVRFTGTSPLAGYEFEIAKYDHKTHTFTINEYEDKRGLKIPDGGSYSITKGSKYVLLDIVMPKDPYEVDAEKELKEEGEKDLAKVCQPMVDYELDISSFSLERTQGTDAAIVNVFKVGDYLPVVDKDINVDKNLRIKGFTRNAYNDPYSYKVTLGDTIDVSIVQKLIEDTQKHDEVITINNLTDTARARQSWRTTQELLNMVFDSDGYFDAGNIRPASIETMMLSVGNRASQFVMQDVQIVCNPIVEGKPNTQVITINTTGKATLIHYAIEDKVRTWNWSTSNTWITLTSAAAYYVYARCEKDGTAFSIIVSQAKMETEVGSYYYFLVGILSSVFEGYRELTLTYGSTRITGRTINCGKIESIDKNTYFDLDNSEIGGNIKFRSTDGTLKEVVGLETGLDDANGNITSLQQLVEEEAAKTSDLTTKVDDYVSKTDDLEDLTELLSNGVSANGTSITEMQGLINGQGDSIKDLMELTDQLKEQIDGTVEYYYGAGVPSNTTYPANEWHSFEDKQNHVNDMYVDTESGLEYRYTYSRQKGYYWQEIASSGIGSAIQKANEAMATANGKNRVYVTASATDTPPATYHKGDLWFMLDTQKMKYCTTDSDGVSYQASHWADAGYTDDTAANKAQAEIDNMADDGIITPVEKLQLALQWAELQADYAVIIAQATAAKVATTTIERIYKTLKAWSDEVLADMSTNSEVSQASLQKMLKSYYTARANLMKAITDKKSTIHVTANSKTPPPTSYKKGDLWFMLDTYKVKLCVTTCSGTYNANDWKDAGYTDDTAANKAQQAINDMGDDAKLTPSEKLTLQTEMGNITADFVSTSGKATAVGVNTTALEEAYASIKNYTDALLADMEATSDVDRTEYNGKFAAYYTERNNVLLAIAQMYVDALEIGQGNYIANGAFFSSKTGWQWGGTDTDLTADRKQTMAVYISNVRADNTKLRGYCTAYGVSVPSEFASAYSALMSYISPLLSDMTTTSRVDTPTINAKCKAYDEQRAALAATLVGKGAPSTTKDWSNTPSYGGDMELYADTTMGNVFRMRKQNTSLYTFLHTAFNKFGGNLMLADAKFRTGITYTLAFWAKANKQLPLLVGFMNPAGDKVVAQYVEKQVGTEWQRIVYTFTAQEQKDEDTRLFIRLEKGVTYEYLMFSKFVLVEGSKAPEWTSCADELKAKMEANEQTLKAITDNYTQIDGGLILSTYLKLGALLNGTQWLESAGVKAMLKDKNEVAAYFGGTLAEAIAGKNGMTIIKHDGSLKADNAEITGKVTATSGEFRGRVIINNGTIQLNTDGSGKLANGSMQWDEEGNLTLNNITMQNLNATSGSFAGTINAQGGFIMKCASTTSTTYDLAKETTVLITNNTSNAGTGTNAYVFINLPRDPNVGQVLTILNNNTWRELRIYGNGKKITPSCYGNTYYGEKSWEAGNYLPLARMRSKQLIYDGTQWWQINGFEF